MLSFVFRKILNKKWMAVSLLIGNLLMVSIAAASPMYSQAVLQRALIQDLNSYLTETNRYPGTIYARGQASPVLGVGSRNIQQMEQTFFDIDEQLQLPSLAKVTCYSLDGVSATAQEQVDGEKNTLSLDLACYTDLAGHIRMMHGEMYSPQLVDGAIEVIVSEKTFVEQNLVLGKELVLERVKDENGTPYRIRITGIFENKDAQDPYWLNSPAGWGSKVLMDEGLFRELFTGTENPRSYTAAWHTVLDYTRMRADRAEPMLQTVTAYQETLKSIGGKGIKIYFLETLQGYVTEAQKLNTTILVLQVPIFVLLAAFIFMVSRQMLEIEQNEISVFKSRGASKGQIIRIYLLQSALIAVAGIAGGIPLGVLICRLIGASNDFLSFVQRTALPVEVGSRVWLFAAAAALLSICTMVLPVIRYSRVTIVSYKQNKNRVRRRSWWQTIFLDVILLGISLYGLYQFKGQEEYLAEKVMEGASLDPMLYFCSSLFMMGAGLLFLRLLPWLVRLVFQLGKKWWPPAIYTSFLRILRARDNQGFLVVFLVLTISMGIFSTQMARTINANSEERIRYVTGADVVLQEEWADNSQQVSEDTTGLLKLSYTEPDFGKYLEMDGVESATRVLVDRKASISVNGGKIQNTVLMGIHTREFGETAWFKESLLPVHWYQYLNAMSRNAKAILVSSNLRDKYGCQVGDTLIYTNANGDSARGVIYGFVDYWPGYSPVTRAKGNDGIYKETENFLVVAHLSQLQSDWGVTPYQVWIKTKGSSQFLYDYAEQTGTRYAVFEDTAAKIIALKNDPVFQGTNGILTIGFIIVLLLCTTGFLIYWILSIQSRTLQFGIFRAMGMSKWEVLSMLLNEQLFISGISIGAGVLVGRICSALYVPLIQLAYSASDRVIPLEIISQLGDFARLGAVIGIMLALCMVILGILISKIKISQALKLGED